MWSGLPLILGRGLQDLKTLSQLPRETEGRSVENEASTPAEQPLFLKSSRKDTFYGFERDVNQLHPIRVLTWNRTHNPVVHRMTLQPTEPPAGRGCLSPA